MLFEEVNKILQFISAFILVFLAIIILLQKDGRKAPGYFLSAFFISRALIILFFASYFYPNLIYHTPDLYVIGEPILFLYAPFLFLYTRSVTSNDRSVRWYDGLHFIPFLLVLTYFLIYFHFAEADLKIQMLLGDELWDPFIVNGMLLWIQFAVYALWCIYLMMVYRIKVKLYNSSYNHELFNWLVFLVGAFLLWKGIFISGYLTGIIEGKYQELFKILIELGFLFYASMITYKGIRIPQVVLSMNEDKAYKTSPLSTDSRKSMLKKLDTIVMEEKPFLDPEITLSQLAKQCDIPVHHLSQILNIDLRQNFYSYINKLRIEEAKLKLSRPENSDMTILEILYDVGFNSKSAFNTAFKKHTGMTPTAYRQSVTEEHAA